MPADQQVPRAVDDILRRAPRDLGMLEEIAVTSRSFVGHYKHGRVVVDRKSLTTMVHANG